MGVLRAETSGEELWAAAEEVGQEGLTRLETFPVVGVVRLGAGARWRAS